MSEADQVTTAPFWQEHVGLVVSAALSIFVVLKVSAVARWNPVSARGILAENGTADVLIGSTLTSLPMLVLLFVVVVLPRLEARLELDRRIEIERSAASLVKILPTLLLMFVVPVYLLVVLSLVVVVVPVGLRLVFSKLKVRSRVEDRMSRFEADAVLVAAVLWALWGALPVPWLPPESIEVGGRPAVTGYVLAQEGQDIVILMDDSRLLQRLDSRTVERAFCDTDTVWYQKTLLRFLDQPDYSACP